MTVAGAPVTAHRPAAQKQAAAELGRLRKEAWIGAALMLSGLAMILGSGLILAWSYLP